MRRFAHLIFGPVLACLLAAPSALAALPSLVGHPTFMSPHDDPIAYHAGKVLVVNTPADTLDVIDAARREVVARINVGIDPVAVAIRPDGAEAWVSNHVSDSVSIVDLNPSNPTYLQLIATIQDFDPVTRATRFDEPVGIAFADNDKAYVALSSENQIAVVDVASRQITRRLSINAQDPRAIEVVGERLYVAVFESNNRTQLSGCVGQIDGNLCTFDAFEHAVTNNNVLSQGFDADIIKHPSVPDRDLFIFNTRTDTRVEIVEEVGTLLYGLAVDSQGRAFIAQTDARNDVNGRAGTLKDGLAEMQNRAFLNQITVVNCSGATCASPRYLDLEPLPPVDPGPGMALATPYAVTLSTDERTLFATAANSNMFFALNVGNGVVRDRIAVDAVPRGITLDSQTQPSTTLAWVLNVVANTVSIIDVGNPAALDLVGTVALDDPTHPVVKAGRTVFHDANASTFGTFACESCHPDGHTDQLLWILDTPQCNQPGCTQIPPRITMPVRGLRDTAPFHWDGIPGDPYGGNNTANIFGVDPPNCDVNNQASCTRNLVDGGLASTMCKVGMCPINDEGKAGAVGAAERDVMSEFLLSVPYPPAQRRAYDNELSAVAEAGFRLFHIDGDLQPQPNVCGNCHRMPFWISTNTPGTGMEAPTWRGAYDRWLILPQARLNVIGLDFYRNLTGAGVPEQQMWRLSWAGRTRFDPVWNMVTEGSTGYSGSFARQVTLGPATAESTLTASLLDALEQSADEGGIVLQGEGVLIEDEGAFPLAVEYDLLAYRSLEDSGEWSRAELITLAANGELVLTLTARTGARVDHDHPQPAIWPPGPNHIQRGRQQFPILDGGETTLAVSGRHIRTGAHVIVDGRRVPGNVRCQRGELPDCAGENVVVQLAALPPDPGMHLLQIQNRDGLFSNDFIFHTTASGQVPDYDFSGPWFAAGQDGHGWFLEQVPGATPDDPDLLNAYWYVYQDGAPVWLVGLGQFRDGRAELNTFITAGGDAPPGFDPDDVNLTPWGRMSFEFADDDTASVSWRSTLPGFTEGSLNIQRVAPITNSVRGCRSGSYFSPEQPGHGFVAQVVSVNGQTEVLFSWYVYRDGEQIWLLGQAPLADGRASIPMVEYAGAEFPPDFDRADVTTSPWGTIELRFTGPDSARVDWVTSSAGFADGGIDVVRLTGLTERNCG